MRPGPRRRILARSTPPAAGPPPGNAMPSPFFVGLYAGLLPGTLRARRIEVEECRWGQLPRRHARGRFVVAQEAAAAHGGARQRRADPSSRRSTIKQTANRVLVPLMPPPGRADAGAVERDVDTTVVERLQRDRNFCSNATVWRNLDGSLYRAVTLYDAVRPAAMPICNCRLLARLRAQRALTQSSLRRRSATLAGWPDRARPPRRPA